MKIVEYQHRNEGGGNSVLLDNQTWEHGEEVLIFSKREIRDLLTRAQKLIGDMMPGVRYIALPSYSELNDVQVDLIRAVKKIEDPYHTD